MLSISLHLAKPSVFGLFLDREASDRACFGVAHLEYREYRRQPGDLQDFLKLAAQVAQLERSALGLVILRTSFFLPSWTKVCNSSRRASPSAPSTMRPSRASTDAPFTSRFVIFNGILFPSCRCTDDKNPVGWS